MPLNQGSKQGEKLFFFFVGFSILNLFFLIFFLVFGFLFFVFVLCSISRYKGVNVSKPIQSATELLKSMMIKKRGFYRGLTPALLRAFPAHGSIFVGYEMTVKLLSVVRGENTF